MSGLTKHVGIRPEVDAVVVTPDFPSFPWTLRTWSVDYEEDLRREEVHLSRDIRMNSTTGAVYLVMGVFMESPLNKIPGPHFT